jgi:hypothetical protein
VKSQPESWAEHFAATADVLIMTAGAHRGGTNPMIRRSLAICAVLLPPMIVLNVATVLAVVSPADGLLPVEQYTSEKARGLAIRYGADLSQLSATVYHCIPWVEVEKYSIGFFRPRHVTAGDDRYLSLRIFVEQDPSPGFASLPLEGRASAMFSRYVGPLLRRMTRNAALLDDSAVDGFSVVVEWVKQIPQTKRARPVHETIAVFVDQATAREYRANRLAPQELADRARVLAWDGETSLGPLRVVGFEDDFVDTYQVRNYKLAPGITCP